jgi:hypothetical protein
MNPILQPFYARFEMPDKINELIVVGDLWRRLIKNVRPFLQISPILASRLFLRTHEILLCNVVQVRIAHLN